MMNQQPDKIFHEKLQGYQQPVPSGTWNRVSKNLKKDDRRVVWLRVAATVLVLITSGVLLYPVIKDESTDAPLAQHKIEPRSGKPDVVKPIAPNTPPAEYDEKKSADPAPQRDARAHVNRLTQRASVTEETVTPPSSGQEEVPALAATENSEAIPDVVVDVVQLPEEVPPSAPAVADRKSVTIVFTTNEVNEKYLTKKETTEATRETKEASSFKRLLDKAYDLKTNQDLLGELRQKKNEILAMNFRNDKQDTVND